MAILTANNLGQIFGADELFSGIDVELQPKDRVGLVGPNGVGKTTLLLILAGLQEAAAGEVHRQKELTLGYLRQEAVLTFAGQDNTIYEEMLTVFSRLREQEQAMRQMEAAMAGGDASEELLEEYGRLQEQYEHAGGYQYQVDIKRVLLGLGFEQSQWETPLPYLSGGQKTRVLLGRLLLEKPDLLILDEPTNHLDVAAIEWLENILRQWAGALILVSHDRYFLDKIINRVWEMSGVSRGIKQYRGNYTAYVTQRQMAWEREQQLFETEKEKLEREIEFIRKHIAGGQADIAGGKLKRLTRDIILLEQVATGASLDELQSKSWLEIGGRARTLSANQAARRLRDITPPADGPPRLNIRLQAERRSGRLVLRTGELEIGYPKTPLFTTEKIRLERLDCAALIGPNGSGKTTFLRTLMGELPTLNGWIKFGESVITGYFAQGHDQLKMDNRVIDEITGQGEMQEAEARNFLAPYLFRGDDVFKKVGELSGGERGRLALAVLSLSGANFLLLDEPTNHLDIPSQEVLQSVLESFDGSILMISHDRYLIDRLATQIWELEDGRLRIFKGSYQEFVQQKEREPDESGPAVAMPSPDAFEWLEEAAVPPVGRKRQRQVANRLRELEAEIEEAEAWVERIQFEMEDTQSSGDQVMMDQLRDEMVVIQARLAELTAEYDALRGY